MANKKLPEKAIEAGEVFLQKASPNDKALYKKSAQILIEKGMSYIPSQLDNYNFGYENKHQLVQEQIEQSKKVIQGTQKI